MGNSVKRLAVLGSTGSIGQQTLEVVRAFPQRFHIIGLAAGHNTTRLAQQIDEFQPEFAHHQATPHSRLTETDYKFISLEEMASLPQADIVVIATSGRAGLEPTLAAVRAGKTVALANKESLVTAGEIVTGEAQKNSARILPIDSEHSAIWQCLNSESQAAARLILTASGGPFYGYSAARLKKVTLKQALKHPSWRMGKKVTVDSATLMNKGLEVIEAHWLFDMPYDSISIVIHPQSIIHSLVEFIDGSVKAQLSFPDMRLPIQYALAYPQRLPNPDLHRLDWGQSHKLTFDQPNLATFPCLRLALEAGRKGGTYPAVLCAADEVAVNLFLKKRIGFTDIAHLIEQTLNQHQAITHPTLEEILTADAWARDKVNQLTSGDS